MASSVPAIKVNKDKILGRGGNAVVFLGTFGGKEVAIKRIQLLDLDEAIFSREEDAMKQLDHPNIVKLLYVEKNADFKFLVLELCEATVEDYIQGSYNGSMPIEREALKQMTEGLNHIHLQSFVHRDIKPANVLIYRMGNQLLLKISDFGISRLVSVSGNFSAKSKLKGTRMFYAPEYLELEGKSEEERELVTRNKSIDIFSLGCLFFSYISKGGHPFAETRSATEIFILPNIIQGKKFLENGGLLPNHYAYKIIDGMTQRPTERWGLSEVLQTLN